MKLNSIKYFLIVCFFTLFSILTYASLLDGLIAYWEFNGDATDASGNGHDGTVVGATLTTDRFGNEDAAYSFDGYDFITVPDSPDFTLGSNPFTITVWSKLDALSTDGGYYLMGHDEGPGTTRKWIFFQGNSSIYFITTPVGWLYLGPYDFQVGDWHHLAIRRDGDLLTAFVDGTPIGSAAFTATIPDPVAPLWIGDAEDEHPGRNYRGSIDSVRIYSRALSQDEIQSLVDEPNPFTNNPPILDPIGNQTVTSGSLLTLNVVANDPDGDNLILRTSSLPDGAVFQDNGDGTGIFSWPTTESNSGCYPPVTFSATDDGSPSLSDSEEITICVSPENNPPVLTPIGNQAIESGELLTIHVTATDPDDDLLVITASDLPIGATFTDHGDGTADFNWLPALDVVGIYDVTFIVSDNGDPPLSDYETISISVSGNQPPVLDPVGDQEIDGGDTLRILLTATDPDGDQLTMSAANLPTGATFTDAGDGTAVFLWTPPVNLTGNFPVTFTVVDNGVPPASDWESIIINVDDTNRPPYQYRIGNRVIHPDEPLTLRFHANDPEGNELRFTIDNPPEGSIFTPNNDEGWAEFAWLPGPEDVGNFRLGFIVTDNALPMASDWEYVAITVGEINRPPVLAPVGNHLIDADNELSITLIARDPDGDELFFTVQDLPSGANFIDNNNGTALFNWTPTVEAVGNHGVTLSVSDGDEADNERIVITVGEINRPPHLNPLGDWSVKEGDELWIPIITNDPDGDAITLTVSNIPPGAVFEDYHNGTAVLQWSPDEEADVEITIVATDSGSPSESASENISIVVKDACEVPEPPEDLKARITRNYVLLRWSSSEDADEYSIYRRVNEIDPFEIIGTTSAISYRDRDYAMGDEFDQLEYYITASNDCGESVSSTLIIVKPKGNR